MRLRYAVSWDAWPKAGQSKMTTVEDLLYKDNLGGKKYMMGVSPWFYTGRFLTFVPKGSATPDSDLSESRFGPVEQALVLL